MMNRVEYLLTVLMEEAAEVQVEASKCIRFGLEGSCTKHETTPIHRLLQETVDFVTILDMLSDEVGFCEAISKVEVDFNAKANIKRKRVELNMASRGI